MLMFYAVALKMGYVTEEEIIKIEGKEFLEQVKNEGEKLEI